MWLDSTQSIWYLKKDLMFIDTFICVKIVLTVLCAHASKKCTESTLNNLSLIPGRLFSVFSDFQCIFLTIKRMENRQKIHWFIHWNLLRKVGLSIEKFQLSRHCQINSHSIYGSYRNCRTYKNAVLYIDF